MMSLQIKMYILLGAAIVIAAAIAAHFFIVGNLKSQIKDLKLENSDQKVQIIALESENNAFRISAETQNKAITEIVDRSARASSAAQKALTEFAKLRGVLQNQLDVLVQQKSTGDMLSDCQILNNNLDAEIDSRSK
jgi:uncharacterized protein (UPF0333 family)